MFHDFLPRCIMRSFNKWGDGDLPEDAGDDDYRKLVKKKLWKVVHSLEPCNKVERVVVNWLSAPLDHTWACVQKLDAEGKVLQALAHDDTSPFVAAVRSYSDMVAMPLDKGPLKALIFHFEGLFENAVLEETDDISMNEILDQLRILSCSLAGQITWRMVWLFRTAPFTAVLMVDERLDYDAQLEVAVRIHQNPECENDPYFLRKAFLINIGR